MLQQSIAMVGAAGDDLVDGTSASSPEGDDLTARAFRATLAMEGAVKTSNLDWIILRGGLFYGPGTGFEDEWFARAAAEKLRLPGDGSDFVSLVHIADMAAATVARARRMCLPDNAWNVWLCMAQLLLKVLIRLRQTYG